MDEPSLKRSFDVEASIRARLAVLNGATHALLECLRMEELPDCSFVKLEMAVAKCDTWKQVQQIIRRVESWNDVRQTSSAVLMCLWQATRFAASITPSEMFHLAIISGEPNTIRYMQEFWLDEPVPRKDVMHSLGQSQQIDAVWDMVEGRIGDKIPVVIVRKLILANPKFALESLSSSSPSSYKEFFTAKAMEAYPDLASQLFQRLPRSEWLKQVKNYWNTVGRHFEPLMNLCTDKELLDMFESHRALIKNSLEQLRYLWTRFVLMQGWLRKIVLESYEQPNGFELWVEKDLPVDADMMLHILRQHPSNRETEQRIRAVLTTIFEKQLYRNPDVGLLYESSSQCKARDVIYKFFPRKSLHRLLDCRHPITDAAVVMVASQFANNFSNSLCGLVFHANAQNGSSQEVLDAFAQFHPIVQMLFLRLSSGRCAAWLDLVARSMHGVPVPQGYAPMADQWIDTLRFLRQQCKSNHELSRRVYHYAIEAGCHFVFQKTDIKAAQFPLLQ